MRPIPLILVHAGAGTMDGPRQEIAKAACTAALTAGLDCLASGGAAVEAARLAVRVLEEDPACNAGRGSVLTSEGTIEIDAGIMDGQGLRFGAVGAMPNCGNGIDVAKAVMDDGRYVLLVGEGAWRFARGIGIEPRGDLVVPRARERFARDKQGAERLEPGTVGACAIDAEGHLAAATSTGGTSFKPPGRVGDTPLCGAGTYADDSCGAASATGMGEGITRVTMARRCCEELRRVPGDRAAWNAVDALAELVDGSGGIICIGSDGRPGVALNTDVMPFGIGRLQPQGDGTSMRELAVGIRIERDVNPISLLG